MKKHSLKYNIINLLNLELVINSKSFETNGYCKFEEYQKRLDMLNFSNLNMRIIERDLFNFEVIFYNNFTISNDHSLVLIVIPFFIGKKIKSSNKEMKNKIILNIANKLNIDKLRIWIISPNKFYQDNKYICSKEFELIYKISE